MDIFNVITLIGGLTFFLYGMHVLSTGLEKMAGGKLEKALKKMTSNPFKSLALGAGITIAIQSSSAMTVMLVGLVNSGIMELAQTVGVIMGSNIGTTLTAWIFSLSGVESDNVAIKMLKPENFSPIIAFIGIIFIMMSKNKKKKDIGAIFVGFSILMYGMQLMTNSVSPLKDVPQFSSVLTAFKNPLLGVLVGTVVTGIIQSSAASVGILQALALTGNISFGIAIPIIMGQNIGTCVTSLLSSIGVNKNAKRVAVVHITFNLIGTATSLILFYGADMIFNFSFFDRPINALGIAAVHSVFNVFTTLLLLPFSKMLVKIANKVIKDTTTADEYSFIDERLLNTPSVAVSECNSRTKKMCRLANDTIQSAMQLFEKYDADTISHVMKNEDELDIFEDKLGTYLVKLASKDISDADSRQISKMLHTIGDFERLGDHAVNLVRVADEMNTKSITFSEVAQQEIGILKLAIIEILDLTTEAFTNNDLNIAKKVEPLEQVIDNLIAEIKIKHIERLQVGSCTIEMGFILSDLLTNFERVSDHCSNIAVALIEVNHNSFETHEYLNNLKDMSDDAFKAEYKAFSEKYILAQ